LVDGDSASFYFANSLASPVQFTQAVEALPQKANVYEVGPSSGLLKLVAQTRSDVECISLVKRNQPKTESIFSTMAPMKDHSTVFVFCGEGAHSSSTDLSILKTSPAWAEVADAVRQTINRDLTAFLEASLGTTNAPDSILTTTIINILHASLWESWGVKPDVVIGHSSGDVAGMYAAGMYSTLQAIRAAHDLGRIAATQQGGMLYTTVESVASFPSGGLHVAGINSKSETGTSVTLCGSNLDITSWLAQDTKAQRINSAHPWHHPIYADICSAFLPMPSGPSMADCTFISTTAGGYSPKVPVDQEHWQQWVSSPTDLPGAMSAAARALSPDLPVVVIECGSHPVARAAASRALSPAAHVASARKDMPAMAIMREARAALVSAGALKSQLSQTVKDAFPDLNYEAGFAEQGVDSQKLVLLASELKAFFPGLAVPDLYHHRSLSELVELYDASARPAATAGPTLAAPQNAAKAAMVLAVGLHLPPGIDSEAGAWNALVSEQIAIDSSTGCGRLTSFNHKEAGASLGVSKAELDVIDPQQVLALSIVDSMWRSIDSALKSKVLSNKERVGVYMGVWQTAPLPADKSAYSVLGSAHSALASRIANAFDFQGPAMAVNTACSSSLVAVDQALKDMRAGRVDYAVVGGVNLLGDNAAAQHLRQANFLSPTFRCHTFSAKADGYVRSEGGVCFLLAQDDGESPCKALILGSAVNQNSQRKPITSVDPEAQARLIAAACRDASVEPSQIDAVEMHGTGTRIGDPVELTALSKTMGSASGSKPCLLTAAKMHFGHLESAAGGLGMLKAVMMLENQRVPMYSVPQVNPMVTEAMKGSRLAMVTGSAQPLAPSALVGVSSFGFTGNNAHVIVQGAGPRGMSDVRKPIVAYTAPSAAVQAPAPTPAQAPAPAAPAPVPAPKPAAKAPPPATPVPSGDNLRTLIATCRDLGVDIPDNVDSSASIIDLGIDSLGIAELSSRLDLPGVDSIFEDPALASIAAMMSGAAPAPAPAAIAAPVAAPAAPSVSNNQIEQSLQTVIATCRDLGVDIPADVDSSASIIDLGIDSLGIAELSSRLGLPGVDSIFESPSLHSIASLMSGSEYEPAASPAPAHVAAPMAPAPGNVDCHCCSDIAATAANLAKSIGDALEGVIAACNELGVRISPGVNSKLSVLDLGMDALGVAALAARLGLPGPEAILKDPTLQAIAALSASVTPARPPSSPNTPTTPRAVPHAFTPPASTGESEWIKSTHVGSLPRRKGATLDEMVRMQREAGVDVVNDGEMTRADYISDVLSRINGVHTDGAMVDMPMASDMNDAPQHSKRFTGINGLITLNKHSPARSKLACVGPPVYVDNGAELCKANLTPLVTAAAAQGLPPSSCFWSVPSPGTIALFCANQYYSDYTTYVNALAEALRPEYEAIAATGVMLQVDAPDLAMGRHTRYDSMTDNEFLELIFKTNMLALNKALVNVPTAQTRVHICWGNYPGPHTKDINASLLWPHLVNLKAKYILCEMANPRHGADLQALSSVAHLLGDKVIVPGVVESTNPRVEHPELIAQRLVQIAALVGPNRVMAGTDCGFASTANALAITEDIVWMKIAAMAEGAKLASRKLYNTNAPATTELISCHATARVVLCGSKQDRPEMEAVLRRLGEERVVVHTVLVDVEDGDVIRHVKWRIDWPIVCVGMSSAASSAVDTICSWVNDKNRGDSVARRPAFPLELHSGNADSTAMRICDLIKSRAVFDKRGMVGAARPLLPSPQPEAFDVVVVGSGLLGMYAAAKIAEAGMTVTVLERRNVTGGIWSMYANSTSQVNTSEGAYCIKELLSEDVSAANRDHSSAAEILTDLQQLAERLGDRIRLGASVTNVAKQQDGGYIVHVTTAGGANVRIASRGVVMAINDRVGVPRNFAAPGMESSGIQVVPGICDATSSLPTWKGKRVVVYGMGAFAVEATRTALEAGAASVVVVARRIGTVCPKIIDYQNFVNDWDDNFQHDVKTNAQQMQRWNRLYRSSGAQPPACWPGKIKPQGHTISVSDIWFVAHHMGKLTTQAATIDSLDSNAVVLDSGERLPCDILVPCIGFERNTSLCRDLTGYSQVCGSNYLDKHLIYLADAEIDDNAFNSFFGSSVLEYAKFYTNVYIEGLRREEQLGHLLWGSEVERVDIDKRAWSQYIRTAHRLFKHDATIKRLAREQVDRRTDHFMASLAPPAYEASNRQEWEDIHATLNGGVPVPKAKQLPYYLDF